MHAYSSIIHNSQEEEQPKCPVKDEWISKMRYVYIHNEILLNFKEIMTHATLDEP